MPLVACVQLNGSSDTERNLATTDRLVRQAAAAGAVLVATPEATTYLGPHDRKLAMAEPVDGPTHRRLGALAADCGIHLLVGSVPERHPDPVQARRLTYNTSLLFGPDGTLLAVYRKIHLFDVDLSDDGGVRFAESARTAPGQDVVLAPSPIGPLGLSICYDLRFPELYAEQLARGATALAIPSAFTERTGRDHWHVLLKARAIETQCFVLAPAQWGPHDDRGLRRSYGHSLILDPWGRILAECADGEGICLSDLDLEQVAEVRRRIPVATSRRNRTLSLG
ncbi:MAG: carbon-nitrogen hydrolase family protein [Oligoflexia bacterium]|nr:carbon-nitrogen hydrolase family protein [Oligoflexia bacterium]